MRTEQPIYDAVVNDLGWDPHPTVTEEVLYREDPAEEAEEQPSPPKPPERHPTAAERRKARQRPAPGTVT